MSANFISVACAGHLLLDLPIFMGPVGMLVGWLWFVTRRERRRERAQRPMSA